MNAMPRMIRVTRDEPKNLINPNKTKPPQTRTEHRGRTARHLERGAGQV